MAFTLKQEFVEKIKEDTALQGAIARATGRSIQSPLRWANKGSHDKLTMLSTLTAIREYYHLPKHESLVDEVKQAA